MGGGKTGMARRLSYDNPSLTLTCAPAQKQTERCHPEETRPLTVREYASFIVYLLLGSNRLIRFTAFSFSLIERVLITSIRFSILFSNEINFLPNGKPRKIIRVETLSTLLC
jgi:hypothetical protein